MCPKVVKVTIRDVSQLDKKPRKSKVELQLLGFYESAEELTQSFTYNKPTDSIQVFKLRGKFK